MQVVSNRCPNPKRHTPLCSPDPVQENASRGVLSLRHNPTPEPGTHSVSKLAPNTQKNIISLDFCSPRSFQVERCQNNNPISMTQTPDAAGYDKLETKERYETSMREPSCIYQLHPLALAILQFNEGGCEWLAVNEPARTIKSRCF